VYECQSGKELPLACAHIAALSMPLSISVVDLPSAVAQGLPTYNLTQLIGAVEGMLKAGERLKAITCYRDWLADTESLDKYVAWFNLGVLLAEQRDSLGAQEAYRSSLALRSDFVQARINLGLLLERQKDYNAALEQWGCVVASELLVQSASPEHLVVTLNHMGRVQELNKQFDKAEQALMQSLRLKPKQPDVIQHLIFLRAKQCKWPVYQDIPEMSLNEQLAYTSPLAMLALQDDPALQWLASQALVKRKYAFAEKRASMGGPYRHDKVRVGYVSGDLCAHAVGLLLPDVIEAHDRESFEIYAFDYSPEDGSSVRRRLLQAFDHVVHLHDMTDQDAAQVIANFEIDVLIDMHGLSAGARPGLFALRPAPLQGSYLGFMGSTAMPWIDFVVTDRYVWRDVLKPFYSEKPLFVEGGFLPLCRASAVPELHVSRASEGLPENAVVLVNFNNVYKINAAQFSVWMHVLLSVDEAVLWLLDDNASATQQLKNEARRHGVCESRLFFAARTGFDVYRARLKLADLYLDTHPYNAGSTARDVLECGLPMVTFSGQTTVSRMAASLLKQVGLDDLITASFSAYEKQAIRLAKSKRLRARYQRILQRYWARPPQQAVTLTQSLEAQWKALLALV
jgi:predicted O-linked N-acetylglucosamine transferase (SPINDLY family)